MPRPPRADEAGGLYHALNRGNLRADIFKKEGDFVTFEKTLFEGLQLHQIELFSYQLMSNHYHLVLRPLVDGEMSRFMGWVSGTHTMCYHAHYHTSGLGHVYQQRYKSFLIQHDEHFYVVGNVKGTEEVSERYKGYSRLLKRSRPLPLPSHVRSAVGRSGCSPLWDYDNQERVTTESWRQASSTSSRGVVAKLAAASGPSGILNSLDVQSRIGSLCVTRGTS